MVKSRINFFGKIGNHDRFVNVISRGKKLKYHFVLSEDKAKAEQVLKENKSRLGEYITISMILEERKMWISCGKE